MKNAGTTERRGKHRTKLPKIPRRKLAEHPAMQELSRMIDAGEVNRERTLAYLQKGRKP